MVKQPYLILHLILAEHWLLCSPTCQKNCRVIFCLSQRHQPNPDWTFLVQRNAADQRPNLNMIIFLLWLSGTNHVDCSYGEGKKKKNPKRPKFVLRRLFYNPRLSLCFIVTVRHSTVERGSWPRRDYWCVKSPNPTFLHSLLKLTEFRFLPGLVELVI